MDVGNVAAGFSLYVKNPAKTAVSSLAEPDPKRGSGKFHRTTSC